MHCRRAKATHEKHGGASSMMRDVKWRARRLCLLAMILVLVCPGWQPALAQVDGCPEPNDAPDVACTLMDGAVVQSRLEQPADRDVYRIVVEPGTDQIAVDLSELPADYDLYLTDSNNQLLGESVQEGTAPE